MRGKLLVRRQIAQAHVFDRMAERPMSDVVQQSRAQQDFGPMAIDHFAEARIFAELPEIADRVVKHAQRMLEAGVRRTGIDPRGQAQLGDVFEPLKLRRIDQTADAGA